MATPFQDFLRDREYTGRPLVVSNQCPAPEGTDFLEVGVKEDPGVGTVHRGRLLMVNDQGVPTWTWVKLLRPRYFSTGFILTHYGAQLKGGARMLMYCQMPGREFLAIEAKGGMDLPFFLQYRADVGRHASDEAERLESISYEMVRQVLRNNEDGVFHMDLDLDSVIVDNYADKNRKTYGPGDVHLVGYQRRGMVSDKFRDEAMGVQPSHERHEMCSTLSGNGRLLRVASLSDHTTPSRLRDPLDMLHDTMEYLVGEHTTADERAFANEALLERYHLADCVFRIFGGDDVDSPKPPSMPNDLFDLLIRMSTPDNIERYHPDFKLKKHPWMKRRAAIAAAVSKGGKHTDLKPTRGETRRAFLKPQAKTGSNMRDDGDAVDPSNVFVQTVRGTGGEGAAAAAEADARAASVGPAVKVLETPPGSPSGSGSDPGSGSGAGSGSGSGSWWGSGSGSVLPTVSKSESRPGSRLDSWADSGDRKKYCEDGSGLSSRSVITVKAMVDCEWKAICRGEGTGKGKKDAGARADGGTRVTPTRSTAAAAGLLTTTSSSGSGSGSESNSWWGSGKGSKSASPIVSESGSGSSLILPTVSESDPGSGSSSRSKSGSWWGSEPKSVVPTVSESGTIPSSRRESRADSGESQTGNKDGDKRSSRPTDMDEDVDTRGWRVKGSGEGAGNGEGQKKGGERRSHRGKRVMPMRPTAAAAGLPDSREARAGTANTSGSGSSLILPTASESEQGSGSGSRSNSGSWWGSRPKSVVPTVSESGTSPGSRRESRADSGESQTGNKDGDGRYSRLTDMDEDVGTRGWKVKGSGEGAGKGEGQKKGGERRSHRGKRVMPMRPTAAAAGLPDSREARAGTANTSGSGSSLILPTASESEQGSGSGSRSNSGSWWGSRPKSVVPTVSESGTSPGSRRESRADSGESQTGNKDGDGRSSRLTDMDEDVDTRGWKVKGSGEGAGKGEGQKKGGERRSHRGKKVMPMRPTAAAAGLPDSREARAGTANTSGSGSSLILPTVSESEQGSGAGSRSNSGSWWGSVPKSVVPTVSESGTSPGSRRESRADSGESQTGNKDGDGRSSHPTDMDEDVDTRGWKVKGSGEGTGKGERKKKGGERRVYKGKRVVPMRPTAAAAGLPDSREASAGAANTDGMKNHKRKRPERDAGSDGSVEKSRKRYQKPPKSDGGGPSRAPLAAPVAAAAHESRVVPDGSPLTRPNIGSNAVEPYSPSDCSSIAEPECAGLEWCWGSQPEGIDNAGGYPDADGNNGSSRGGVASSAAAAAAALAARVSWDLACFGASFFSPRRS